MSDLEFLPVSYLKDHPHKPRPVAIKGFVCVGDVVIISGSFDTFKSTLALELAYSLATGEPFLQKHKVLHKIRPFGVLQVEIAPGQYDSRLKAFDDDDYTMIASNPFFTLDSFAKLEKAVADYDLSGLVIDPMGQAWPSVAENGEPFDENKKGHISPLIRKLHHIRDDFTIVMVHHDPKPSSGFQGRASGSAALLNDPDVRVLLTRRERVDGVDIEIRNRNQQPPRDFAAFYDRGRLVLKKVRDSDDDT